MKRTAEHLFKAAKLGLLSVTVFMIASSARATDPIFINSSASYYVVPGNPPPAYDVRAFDNENIFSVGYSVYSPYPLFYETWNTLYYTNNGLMIANSPISTNGLIFGSSFGCGFNFDLQTTNFVTPHAMAGTFFNPGTIRCNSTNDGNGIFTIGGFTFFFVNAIGECLVNASNIINSGTIQVGADGLIRLDSKKSDLSLSQISIEAPLSAGFLISGNAFTTQQSAANITASGLTGTNFVDPTFDFTASTAFCPFFNLTNSTPYVDVRDTGTSNIIVRAVFIYDSNPNITRKVYFGGTWLDPLQFQGGGATIEWDGIYQDSASGVMMTNLLFLNNDYVWGSSTNVRITTAGPNNFQFYQTQPPYPLGTLTSSNFSAPFNPPSTITNLYAYLSASLMGTTVATNASAWNPSGALTNLPGKIFISAADELTLAGAQIGGENYLSINAPRQFNGSEGAFITAPFSDINLGVTNGNMKVANLIANGVGSMSGSVQAWSTRWIYTDAGGTNWDYRVMLVASDLSSQAKSWVQTLTLHATNSVEISDVFNVYKTLSIDSRRLTITTNGYGNGFTSPAGALNWGTTAQFTPTLNTVQLPNLLWLTNNGTLSAANDAVFGTSSLRYGAFINAGSVIDKGTTIWTTNFVNAGMITNGSGAFTLQTYSAIMTNGSVFAGGNISLTSSNNLFISSETIVAGRSLNLFAGSLLADGVPTGALFSSTNFWSVGSLGNSGDGVFLPLKPAVGDLLGTTVTNYAPGNKLMQFQWPGVDKGYSVNGFSNNMAIGHLVLNSAGAAPFYGRYNFTSPNVGGALYVDCIEFQNSATNTDVAGNMQGITFNNLVIYYAQAIRSGQSVAEKLNLKNTNNGVSDATSHFRWVPNYVGYFSYTNLVYPDGTTNAVNAALAQSFNYDSDKDGILNGADTTPFFVPSQINLTATLTNLPPKKVRLSWWSIPAATNTIWYKTNLLSPNWAMLTNFVTPPPSVGPATNLITLDSIATNSMRFYRVGVTPQFP